jgi:hypothetical protein
MKYVIVAMLIVICMLGIKIAIELNTVMMNLQKPVVCNISRTGLGVPTGLWDDIIISEDETVVLFKIDDETAYLLDLRNGVCREVKPTEEAGK